MNASAVAVSVVLPVLNESRDIQRLLEELRRQTPPPGGFEVLVVDGGSRDGTRDIVNRLARDWPELRLLENPKRRSGPARNIGAAGAAGKYVLYLDGHCALPRRDYLVRLVEIFGASGADCLCRPQPLSGLADPPWGEAIARARHSPLGHNPGSDIYSDTPAYTDPQSAGAAYRRKVIAALGGYDERFDACEDVEFNQRVHLGGFVSYRHPDLAVEYRPRNSIRALFAQMKRYGRGRARLMAKHPGTASPVLILFTLASLSPLVVLAAAGPAGALLTLAALALLWLAGAGAESLRLGGFTGGGRILIAFLAIHLGLLAGFWQGLFEVFRYRGEGELQPWNS